MMCSTKSTPVPLLLAGWLVKSERKWPSQIL
jgi:hypothetical protein